MSSSSQCPIGFENCSSTKYAHLARVLFWVICVAKAFFGYEPSEKTSGITNVCYWWEIEAAVQVGSLAEKSVHRFLHIPKSLVGHHLIYQVSTRDHKYEFGKLYMEYLEIFLGAASGHPCQSIQDSHPGDKGKFEAFFGRALKQSLTVFYLGYKKKPSIISRLYLENSMSDVIWRLGKEKESLHSAQNKYSISKCFASSLQ